MFAATTSEDDVKLFKFHLQRIGSNVKVVEIPVAHHIDYDWTYGNLDRSIADGYAATAATIAKYRAGEPASDAPGDAGGTVTPIRRNRRKPQHAA